MSKPSLTHTHHRRGSGDEGATFRKNSYFNCNSSAERDGRKGKGHGRKGKVAWLYILLHHSSTTIMFLLFHFGFVHQLIKKVT